MYAIVDFKGYQYRVEKDATLKVSYMSEMEQGNELVISDILLIHDNDNNIKVGRPTVESAKVTAEILGHGRDKKIIVFKKKKRKGYRKTQGHREYFTEIKIKDIQF